MSKSLFPGLYPFSTNSQIAFQIPFAASPQECYGSDIYESWLNIWKVFLSLSWRDTSTDGFQVKVTTPILSYWFKKSSNIILTIASIFYWYPFISKELSITKISSFLRV